MGQGPASLWLQAAHLRTENPPGTHTVPSQHWGEGAVNTVFQAAGREDTLCIQWHRLTHPGSDLGLGGSTGGFWEESRRIQDLSSFSALFGETLTTWGGLEGSQEGASVRCCETGQWHQGLWCLGFLEEYTFMLCSCVSAVYIHINHIFVLLCMWISTLACVCVCVSV